MANKNIVNNNIDYELLMKALTRTDIERDKGLSVLNKYFSGENPLLNINEPLPGQGDWTPLAFATFFGRNEEAFLLIKLGANVKGKFNNDLTLLHLAANDGRDKLCSNFLINGVHVDSQTKKGFTPMMGACAGGHQSTVNVLLGYNPNIAIKDSSGKSCLDYGVDSGNYSLVAMIRHETLKSDLLIKAEAVKKINKI